MAHVAKYPKSAIGHMFNHYSRDGSDDIVRSNSNIDQRRTHLNYNLAPKQDMSQNEILNKRLSEVRVHNRADIIVLCDWIVTIPKDFLQMYPEREREFFELTYKFLEKRYGKDNVVSAYVHKDEVTPHLHFAFIPVVPDLKRQGYKVSAKETLTRTELRSFHSELGRFLEKEMGVEVNVLNGTTKEGNKSIDELKRKSAIERLDEANKKASQITDVAEKKAQHIRAEYYIIDSLYKIKKAYCDEIDESVFDLPVVKYGKRSAFGKKENEKVEMPLQLFHQIVEAKERVEKENCALREQIDKIIKLSHFTRTAELEKRIEELEQEKGILKSQLLRFHAMQLQQFHEQEKEEIDDE